MTTRWWRVALTGALAATITGASAVPSLADQAVGPGPEAPSALELERDGIRSYALPISALSFDPSTSGALLPEEGHLERSAPVALWSEGAAVARVKVPVRTNHLQVHARADVCEGFPRMVVEVDGTPVLDTEVTTTWNNTAFSARGSFAAGEHDVRIRYTNEHRTEDCDRNLKVGEVSFSRRVLTRTATPLRGTDFTVPADAGTHFRYGRYGQPAFVVWGEEGPAAATAVTQGAHTLVVGARGDRCLGRPRMQVRVNGEVVIDRRVSTRVDRDGNQVTRNHLARGNWGTGTQQVEVRLVNDLVTDACDRNLKVEHVTFLGTT